MYAQIHSLKTTSDIGGPLQKHVSRSDLWLFYRAVVADCSDVGPIHQCQHTLSHTTLSEPHTHRRHESSVWIFIAPFPLSLFLPSETSRGSRSLVFNPVLVLKILLNGTNPQLIFSRWVSLCSAYLLSVNYSNFRSVSQLDKYRFDSKLTSFCSTLLCNSASFTGAAHIFMYSKWTPLYSTYSK